MHTYKINNVIAQYQDQVQMFLVSMFFKKLFCLSNYINF